MVQHGETGLLGDDGDRAALAANVQRLLRDGALRRRLGEQARRTADAHFDLATQTERLERLYDTVARR